MDTPQPHETHEVTGLLVAWAGGDRKAPEPLMTKVYAELSRIAANLLRLERADHTLEPAALVNEAYMRLVRQRDTRWRNRAHFFAIASRMMRRVLLDHAKRLRSAKRGAGAVRVRLRIEALPPEIPDPRLEDLDAVLRRLASSRPRLASVVEMRLLAGMSARETAEALGCSERTVARDLTLARAWLIRELLERDRAVAR